jgi:predicted  nucleic acid-binding Zn-ribbon protein
MGATLDALHRLQEIEIGLLSLRQRINAKHRAVRGAKKHLAQLQASTNEKASLLQHQQAEADRVELERKSREAEVAKLREALNRSKTNKEYSAILTQINTNKADNAKLEDRVLGLLGELDRTKKTIAELAEAQAKEQERLTSLDAAAAEFEASVRDEQQNLETERLGAADIIPPSVLHLFERVAERHDGEAMAEVRQANPRYEEFICGGCNMTIPLERINAIRGRDEIQQCPNCGRILYLEEISTARK